MLHSREEGAVESRIGTGALDRVLESLWEGLALTGIDRLEVTVSSEECPSASEETLVVRNGKVNWRSHLSRLKLQVCH